MKGVNIYSEIGPLKKVFLHRIGKEVEALVPDNFERLLFDDIPFLKVAQFEHDAFAKILIDNGVEVVYFSDQLELALSDKTVRADFLDEFINESGIPLKHTRHAIKEYLLDMPVDKFVEYVQTGVKKSDIKFEKVRSLSDVMEGVYPYYIDPLPNLYFTRDPAACIGNGLNVHSMNTKARRREAICMKYMYWNNEELFPKETPLWYDYSSAQSIEGGDVLVLSKDIVAIGASDRTTPEAISVFADSILSSDSGFKKVLVFDIPKCRAFMHLDTVFTMVDHDKFTIHPEIEGPLRIFEITLDSENHLKFESHQDELTNILKTELKLPAVKLIRCGGDDKLAAQREQWSDGSNTLAIAPGTVITYDRNSVTNELLDKDGIKVLTMPSSELSRGRGGPRCMSMPIFRENI